MPKKRSGQSQKKTRQPAAGRSARRPVRKPAARASARVKTSKAARPRIKSVHKATAKHGASRSKASSTRSGRKPAAKTRAAKKGTGLHKRQAETHGKPSRTQPLPKVAPPRRAIAVAASKPVAKAAPERGPVRAVKPGTPVPVLRRGAPPPTVVPAAPVKGKKNSKAARTAAAEAREAFLHSVIPTRIERLEILRQLYDKRREAPQKQAGTERPNEEEESEGEFVVSDEIVSSDSSEP